MSRSRDRLISKYFWEGHSYREILIYLGINGFSLSLRQLKRILQRMGLCRRRTNITFPFLQRVESAIRVRQIVKEVNESNGKPFQEELRGSSILLGYRSLWATVRRKYRLCVARYVCLSYYSYTKYTWVLGL